jgi:hypothetical protein
LAGVRDYAAGRERSLLANETETGGRCRMMQREGSALPGPSSLSKLISRRMKCGRRRIRRRRWGAADRCTRASLLNCRASFSESISEARKLRAPSPRLWRRLKCPDKQTSEAIDAPRGCRAEFLPPCTIPLSCA